METIQFMATGDWGTDSYVHQLNTMNLEKIKEELDFCILLGDNFYPSGVASENDSQWRTKFKKTFPVSLPCFAILGNHDYIQNPHAQIGYTKKGKNWKMPYFYYDLVVNIDTKSSIHFIFIDTCLLCDDITVPLLRGTETTDKNLLEYLTLYKDLKQKQLKWLNKTLANSKSTWKIVCGHYPVLSNGPHRISKQLGEILPPIFEKFGVHIYLSGHDHNLQHIVFKKTHYVVLGGFSSFYPIAQENTTMKKHYNRFISGLGGFGKFMVNKDGLTMDFLGSNNDVLYQMNLPT